MSIEDPALTRLAARVGRQLLGSHRRVATAESCTGGWIAKALTDIAGSSAWFDEGFVTYGNAAKQSRLGVPLKLLRIHGAVSEPVARAMARGALLAAGADLTVAVTGIAGPGGAVPGKPVVRFGSPGPRAVAAACEWSPPCGIFAATARRCVAKPSRPRCKGS